MVGMRADLSALPSYEKDNEIPFAGMTFFDGITKVRPGQTRAGTLVARNTDGWETLRPIYGLAEGGWAETDDLTREPWYGHGYANSWGYGAEIECARRWQENVWPNVAVIKYAVGGTRLATSPTQWSPPDDVLYKGFVEYTRARLAELTAQGHTYTVSQLVWYQGESDACSSAQYAANLKDLLASLRTALDAAFEVTLIRVRKPDQVRAAVQTVADDCAWCGWVDTLNSRKV